MAGFKERICIALCEGKAHTVKISNKGVLYQNKKISKVDDIHIFDLVVDEVGDFWASTVNSVVKIA